MLAGRRSQQLGPHSRCPTPNGVELTPREVVDSIAAGDFTRSKEVLRGPVWLRMVDGPSGNEAIPEGKLRT